MAWAGRLFLLVIHIASYIRTGYSNIIFPSVAAKWLQSCPTLCDPTDGSPPGSPLPGIPQARTLEWVAISFSNTWNWKVKVKSLSHVRLFATPWTAAHQAPPSMAFSRQEYWSGLPLPSLNISTKGLQIDGSEWDHGKGIWPDILKVSLLLFLKIH